MEYDYLIVGAGLYGATFAHEANKIGKKCLVIDKRKHIGGNIYTEKIDGINIHRYGAHIFHTSSDELWSYVNQFTKFNNFINSPIAIFKNEIYNLPFNMNTFNKLWGVRSPSEAQDIINKQIIKAGITCPSNLEEQAINLVGVDIYEKLIKGYTEKQWGRKASDLPAFIIKRLPLRFTFNNNYFNDKYQGIPVNGYTVIIEKMLENIPIILKTDYLHNRSYFNDLASKIVYTGMIDEYFNYRFGALEYRSLRFEDEYLSIENYQGNAVVNYTDSSVPFTRIIEHKHFEFGEQPHTIITKEYPTGYKGGCEPYYPVNDDENNKLFKQYQELSKKELNVIFGGRLGEYKYYDMHHVIAHALKRFRLENP